MTSPYISPRLRPAEGSPRTHARQGDSPAKQLANARKRAKLQELKESARLLEAEVTDNLLSPIDGIHELQMELLEDRIGQHMEDLGQRIDGKNIENPLTLPPVRKEKVSKAHLAGKNAVDRKTISDKNVGIKQTGKQAERKKIPDKNVGIEKKTVEPVVRTRTSTETRVAKIVQDELRRLLKRKWGNRKQNLVSKAKATSQVQEVRSSELRQTGPELEAQVALTAPETPADGEEGTKEKSEKREQTSMSSKPSYRDTLFHPHAGLGSQQERNDTAYRRELSLQNARHEKEIEDLHREQIIPMQDELRENQNKLAEYYLQAHTTAESSKAATLKLSKKITDNRAAIDRLSLENENLMATIKDHVRSHAARKEFRARERSLSASPSSPSYPSNSRSNSDLSSLKPSLERSPQPPNRSISYSPRPGPKRSDTYTPSSSHGGSPQAKRPSPRPYKPYQPDEPRPKVDSSAFKKVAVAVKKASETWPHASIEVAEQLNSLDNSVVSREERHTIKVFLEVQHQRAMKKNDPWVCPSFDDIGKHFREAAEGTYPAEYAAILRKRQQQQQPQSQQHQSTWHQPQHVMQQQQQHVHQQQRPQTYPPQEHVGSKRKVRKPHSSGNSSSGSSEDGSKPIMRRSVNINQKDQILKKQFSMTKAASVVKPRFKENMNLDGYEQWVMGVTELAQMHFTVPWSREWEVNIVTAAAHTLSDSVHQMWREQHFHDKSKVTWNYFLEWAKKLLVLHSRREVEKNLETIMRNEFKQGTTSIQTHIINFNRLIRKLDLPMMVLLTGFRNSLSPQFQEVSYYDEKSKPFETLEDLTQHLLKKDAVMNSQKREKSQWDKKVKERGPFKSWKAKPPYKTPFPPKSQATSLYAASGSHKSAGGYHKTERVMKLLGPPEEANAKNKKISNAQQLWQMKEGNCPGCHIPYGQCDRPQGKGGSCPHSKPVPEKHMVEAGRVTNEPCPRWGKK